MADADPFRPGRIRRRRIVAQLYVSAIAPAPGAGVTVMGAVTGAARSRAPLVHAPPQSQEGRKSKG
jgi:hypothetical protein